MGTAAIIVAAGRGTRVGGGIPKQWRPIGKKSVAEITLAVFDRHSGVDMIVLILHPDDIDRDLPAMKTPFLRAVGGASRTESVRAGLEAVPAQIDHVLIHDVARPLVTEHLIDRVLHALKSADGAAPALAVTDALWKGDGGTVTGFADRDGLYRAQTPQGFRLKALRDAYAVYTGDAADDVEIAVSHGLSIRIVDGDANNLKITRPGDFERAADLMKKEARAPMDIRVGNGFDVHRFGPGDHVVLCGVRIPFERGLQGHSDADVGLHTITDAIYGALAEGDIGQHFPPSDPQWKGAASDIFLKHAVELADQHGYVIGNIDCTLMCEFPKIGPHSEAMRQRVSDITTADISRVSVKATTTERLGFTGRGEGIAAMATVTLVTL